MKWALAAPVTAVVVALFVIAGGRSARADVYDGRIRCDVFVEDANGTLRDIRAHDSADRTQAIQLSRDDPVQLLVLVEGPVTSHKASLDFEGASYDITPELAALEAPEAQFSVEPSQFLPAGAGLFLLKWEAEGGEACSASALVKMQGVWWREPLGVSAGLTLFLAGVGLVLTSGRSGLAVLQMTVKAMLGRKPEGEEGQEDRAEGEAAEDGERDWSDWLRPRFETSVQLTLVSTFAGFVFGGGLTLLLQQAAIQPLTVQLALQIMLPSTLIPPALEGLVLWERKLLGEGS